MVASGVQSALRVALAMTLFLLMSGCGSRVELFATASEAEANEVLSVLLDNGIGAVKSISKAGAAVSVESEDLARALDILRSRGLPRDRFDGMGQIFKKEGLVSSPLEERARYIYALSQELASTLTQMDGVVTARVHVVLPERGGVGEAPLPSTAAVFIKHQIGYNLETLQPQIRKLVTNSIPGLTEGRVSIVLVAAQPLGAAPISPNKSRDILGNTAAEHSVGSLMAWAIAFGVLLLALLGVFVYAAWRYIGVGRRVEMGAHIHRGDPEPTLSKGGS
jgi:type III secretion protein J